MVDEKSWALSIAEKIEKKAEGAVKRNPDKIPYSANMGVFDDWSSPDKICWWTNGFWAGQLWLLYRFFKNESLKATAVSIEEKLDENLMNYMGMDHDSGFKWLLTSVNHYKFDQDPKAKNRALLAASNLAGRINLASGLIRAWNDKGDGENAGLAIIDCMMNLPLLYWATKVTNDQRFTHIACCHADHAIKAFIRDNGSSNHIVTFDPESGTITGSRGGQGLKEGSAWTRGQAWALYGFSMSYAYTKKASYLETAKKVASYFISQIPEDGHIPVDFDQDKSCTWEDSTAAAIASCGFLELGRHCEENEKQLYQETSSRLIHTLAETRCDWNGETDSLLERCTAAYHDSVHEFPIIYGDYYFTEAILRLAGQTDILW